MKKCKCNGFNREFQVRDFCIQQFPFIAEDFDALTTYELLSKVICFLREMGVQVEELTKAFIELSDDFDKLYEYVMDYFDNLDVQEEINNKLDEMADNGELEKIFARFKSFDGQTLSMLRVLTRNIEKNEYGATYWQMQSMCMPDPDTIIYGLCNMNTRGTTDGLLVRQSLSTGAILQETVSPIAGHMNGMCIYKGELVITPSPMFTSEGVGYHSHEIHFYNPNTFEYLRTIRVPDEVNVNGVATDGERLFVLHGAANSAYVCDAETGDCTFLFKFERSTFQKYLELGQGFWYYQGKFLRPYGRPAYIMVHDDEGKILHNYMLPFVNHGVYVGELECLCDIPGTTDFLLGCHVKCNNLDNSSNVNIFRCNFQESFASDILYNDFGITQGRTTNLYVDRNANGIMPNGTSVHPFLTIQDAIDAVRQNEYKAVNIRIKGSGKYTVQAQCVSTPMIIEAMDGVEVELEDALFTFCNTLHLRDIHFTCKERNNPLYISNINMVRLENCTFTQTKEYPAIRTEYINDFYPGDCTTTGGTYALEAVRTQIHGRVVGSDYSIKNYYLGAFTYFDNAPPYTMSQELTSSTFELGTNTSKLNGLSAYYNENPVTTGTLNLDTMDSYPNKLVIEFEYGGYTFIGELPIYRWTNLNNRYYTYSLLTNNTYVTFSIGISFSSGVITIETNRKKVADGNIENATSESTSSEFLGIRRVFAFYN